MCLFWLNYYLTMHCDGVMIHNWLLRGRRLVVVQFIMQRRILELIQKIM